MSKSVSYVEDAIRLCGGNPRDGVVFYKILKLYPRAKWFRRDDPRPWLVMSYERWGEITGLGEQQVKRAMDSLATNPPEGRGLIEKAKHQVFSKTGGKTTPVWVRPNCQSAVPGKSKSTLPSKGEIDSPGKSKSTLPKDSTSNKTSMNQLYKSADADQADFFKKQQKENQEKWEIVDRKDKQPSEIAANANTVPKLEALWKNIFRCHRGEECSWAKDDLYRLIQLKKTLGAKAGPTIVWAMTHWVTFRERVAKAKAISITPDRPHVGFLLLHRNIALEAMEGIVAGVKTTETATEGWKSVPAVKHPALT